MTDASSPLPTDDPDVLRALARRLRVQVVRMTARARSSHVGGGLSMADLLAVLYGSVLRVDPARPDWPDRDRFILSKGHACAGLYAALAERGFLHHDDLETFYADGSALAGHVTQNGVPGVEYSTGSLGHGLPVACGMALAGRAPGARFRVFALLSDGELDEGSNWEAALFAGHHRLSNLTAIVDYNRVQSLGATSEVLDLDPLGAKWAAFGWQVVELDGHDVPAVHAALSAVPAAPDRPTCVIAHTVKGKGVSFMEHALLWHYRSPAGDELAAALAELGEPGP
ncbi:MAG: transketolase [Vicinamibacterales bacterium]